MDKVNKVTQDLDTIAKEDLMPGIPKEALPTPEFIQQVQRIEARKAEVKPIPIPQPAPVIKATPPTRKPLILKYIWTGNCETCGNDVKTIEVVGDKYNTCIAYCTNAGCDKQIVQQKVIDIKKQLKKGE